MKELVVKFKGRISTEVRRQEKLYRAEEKDFKRRELSGKYTAKMLYGWDNRKFESEYFKKLKRN